MAEGTAAMKAASFFSGIGGFDLGFAQAGIETVVACEFDRQCRKLLNQRFPNIPIIHDIRQIAAAYGRLKRGYPIRNEKYWREIFSLLAVVHVFSGGFPCQDLSVAGERAGLDGERSGLWFTFRRVIGLFRPPVVVIENVPGLLSSGGGRDFAIVLSGLVQLGYRVAWRSLDAQYFGVAQRRVRVFIVGCSGASGARPEEILFEPESLCWDSAPSRETREGTAGTLSARASAGGGLGTDFDLGGGGGLSRPTGTISSSTGGADENDAKDGRLIAIPILEAGARTGVSTDDPRAGIGIGQDGDPMFTLQRGKQHAVAFGGNRTSGPQEIATAVNAHGGGLRQNGL